MAVYFGVMVGGPSMSWCCCVLDGVFGGEVRDQHDESRCPAPVFLLLPPVVTTD